MITSDDFHIGDNEKEKLPIDTDEFPYVCKYAENSYFFGRAIPWHWHTAFEIDYVEDGEANFQTADQVVNLKKGDAVFINSNVLHRAEICGKVKLYAHLFDMHFLSGAYGSQMEERYFRPILKSQRLAIYGIYPDSFEKLRMIENIVRAIRIAGEEPYGYEFQIRALLDEFWCLLLKETEAVWKKDTGRSSMDSGRIKEMLLFIHDHYMEKITLDDIANAAGISGRECTRCFQRNIGQSPIHYLGDYRVRMAAQMLLRTGKSVTEICDDCGFSSLSYFGKTFRESTGVTPREYRKKT